MASALNNQPQNPAAGRNQPGPNDMPPAYNDLPPNYNDSTRKNQ